MMVACSGVARPRGKCDLLDDIIPVKDPLCSGDRDVDPFLLIVIPAEIPEYPDDLEQDPVHGDVFAHGHRILPLEQCRFNLFTDHGNLAEIADVNIIDEPSLEQLNLFDIPVIRVAGGNKKRTVLILV
jgi:hypothetical protein